ncbi:NitT/TauT family transport system substrate-binding protein/sulfonate transport system substrate-binding protein [Paucimonas lemoignei]|uniref:NitT/TauT family transport system substrate-binding protein/sulfonate transport system substrate-binding protein n=1 Tax=Paucimonas lemoignei TaxID=29443 RepID=A0A4R3HZ85_PAULE|nr:ABC transporter substrate-binding protein [Paucimonas lemoignei]TCS38003.1 NitT/TauT family transport system substrate-binding protein/sulfonate transport system substrate-binding protein [Paucimonas lemoignei]
MPALIVGAHPQNISLSVLARRRDYVEDLKKKGLEFFIYSAGAHTIPLVELGVIDIAGTGATPPILAKAKGLDVAVFGISAPRFENGGLCVRADSPFHTIQDLKGRGIALMPISWHTQFTAVELANAGIEWKEVNAVELLPATARDAYEQGLLDAVVLTDPLYSLVAAKVPTRVLASPGQAFTNRSVYWAPHRVLRDHPDAVHTLLVALAESDQQTQENPAEAAALLEGVNGHTAAQWLGAITARDWGVSQPDPGFLAEQQSHADIFARFGLIPKQIDVSDTVDSSFLPL